MIQHNLRTLQFICSVICCIVNLSKNISKSQPLAGRIFIIAKIQTDQYFLMGIDDLYASKRSYDGVVPGAVSPIDCIGPL